MPDKKPKILITGASGYLGGNLARYLSRRYFIIAHGNKKKPEIKRSVTVCFDISSSKEIEKNLAKHVPDFAIHLAAVTSPDECEKEKKNARIVNIEGTRHITDFCNNKGIPVIYISTDLVFDGQKGNYCEHDDPAPTNYYGETKLLAEEIVLSGLDKNIVCRIPLSYGKCEIYAQGGFLDNMLCSLHKKQALNLFTDQYRTPLFSGDFCCAMENIIIHRYLGKTSGSRIYHLGGEERLSRYEIGQKAAAVYGYGSKYLVPTTMASMGMDVKRGSDCSLDISLAKKELGYRPNKMTENLNTDKNTRLKENADFDSY